MTTKKSAATPAHAKTLHDAEYEHHRANKEKRPKLEAYRGARTRLHSILQEEEGIPQTREAGEAMWRRVDALMKEAGIVEPKHSTDDGGAS